MNSIKATSRRAGLLYLVFSIAAIFGEFVFPTFIVPGDASATARNISAAEFTYRIGILAGFVTLLLFIFVVSSLYDLFKDIDRSQSRAMVLLVSIGVTISLANLIHKIAPLILLSGADYLSSFTKPQLDALALAFLRLHGQGITVATVFWGLWLFPFGILVIKSGFFPRALGVLLIVAGFAYLVTSFTSILLPAQRHFVSQIMMPLYFGEVPIIFWLIKGAAKRKLPGSGTV